MVSVFAHRSEQNSDMERESARLEILSFKADGMIILL